MLSGAFARANVRAMRVRGWAFIFGAVAAVMACGGSKTHGPSAPPAPSASVTPPPVADDGKAMCTRICAVQTKCGGDSEACGMRCKPIVRVLQPSIVADLTQCVERHAPATCSDDDKKESAHLLGKCVVDTTEPNVPASRDAIALFAKSYCDRNASCGTNELTSASECLGRARADIMETEGAAPNGLYGSLRPSKLDELVACLGGPCDQRLQSADAEVGRCLDAILAHAAETP